VNIKFANKLGSRSTGWSEPGAHIKLFKFQDYPDDIDEDALDKADLNSYSEFEIYFKK